MKSLLLYLAASAVLVAAQVPERCSKLIDMMADSPVTMEIAYWIHSLFITVTPPSWHAHVFRVTWIIECLLDRPWKFHKKYRVSARVLSSLLTVKDLHMMWQISASVIWQDWKMHESQLMLTTSFIKRQAVALFVVGSRYALIDYE